MCSPRIASAHSVNSGISKGREKEVLFFLLFVCFWFFFSVGFGGYLLGLVGDASRQQTSSQAFCKMSLTDQGDGPS